MANGNGDTRFNNIPGGAVEVTVDGINDASNGYKSGGTVFYTTVPVRLGALEEVSVETSGLGADSGAESGVNIKFITKRGGDQYHGSAFYQPTSEQFNANSWSNNANRVPRAYNRVHNFGGNIGGKLVPFGFLKNKLFFFFNYEYVYNPQVQVNTYSVLTPAAAAGNYTYLVNGTTNQFEYGECADAGGGARRSQQARSGGAVDHQRQCQGPFVRHANRKLRFQSHQLAVEHQQQSLSVLPDYALRLLHHA